MKYIKVRDTYAEEYGGRDNSFIVAVDNSHYNSLKNELEYILAHQEDYDYVYEAMQVCVLNHCAEVVKINRELDW